MNNTLDLTAPSRDANQPYTAAEFAVALRSLADRIEQREPIELQIAGETVVVPWDAAFSIEHEVSESEEEVEFQITWSRSGSAETMEGSHEAS